MSGEKTQPAPEPGSDRPGIRKIYESPTLRVLGTLIEKTRGSLSSADDPPVGLGPGSQAT